MRLVEIRLLEGPNVYRLQPVAKIELALGRRRTWFGQREPGTHALVRLGGTVRSNDWPAGVASLVGWVRRLRGLGDFGEGASGRVRVHRSSDPGHWIVEFPYRSLDRGREIAEGAWALAERGADPAARRARTTAGARLRGRVEQRVRDARDTRPGWIRDADRRVPVVSITGTNGKSTTTRLVGHILRRAGRHVGMTTSDGVYVDERLVDPGDWTGPGGAAQVLHRSDLDVAVLETARGGILLRGVGYESNEASVLTNVTSDHLDLQGIHTLPELAEVKATVCRMTKPDGWVVLNADDPYVAAVARSVRARVAWFSLVARPPGRLVRGVARGGRGYVIRERRIVELEGTDVREIVPLGHVPLTLAGLARHNVANALAAAAAARALGATIDEVADGLRDFRPSADVSPGRLNVFRRNGRVVIVDFAHNEAGLAAVLDVAEGIAAGGSGRAAPVTVIVGTAGDRPDDTLRGLGRIAGRRAQRVVIKETQAYLRGRTRESVVGEIRAGIASASGPAIANAVPVYPSEPAALRAELGRPDEAPAGNGARVNRVIVLLCHESREEVFATLAELGARPVSLPEELPLLVPSLVDRGA
jgi:cyanophycin synthetase